MLIFEDLTRESHLLARHIGNRDLNRTPEFAETQEESRKKSQQKNEQQPELKFLRAKEGALVSFLRNCILLRLSECADLLCLHRRQDACRIGIKRRQSLRIAAHHLLCPNDILNEHTAVRALCWILRHHPRYEGLYDRRYAGGNHMQRLRILFKMFACDAHCRVAVKRNPP